MYAYVYGCRGVRQIALATLALMVVLVAAAVASAQYRCGGPVVVRRYVHAPTYPDYSAKIHELDERARDVHVRLHALYEAHAEHANEHHALEDRQKAIEGANTELYERQQALRVEHEQLHKLQAALHDRQHFFEQRQKLLEERQQILEDRQAYLQDFHHFNRQVQVFAPRDVVSQRQQALIDNVEAGLEDPFDRVFLDGIQLDEFEALVGNLGVQALQNKILLFDRARTRAGFRRGIDRYIDDY